MRLKLERVKKIEEIHANEEILRHEGVGRWGQEIEKVVLNEEKEEILRHELKVRGGVKKSKKSTQTKKTKKYLNRTEKSGMGGGLEIKKIIANEENEEIIGNE